MLRTRVACRHHHCACSDQLKPHDGCGESSSTVPPTVHELDRAREWPAEVQHDAAHPAGGGLDHKLRAVCVDGGRLPSGGAGE